jgi:hypothetical protein
MANEAKKAQKYVSVQQEQTPQNNIPNSYYRKDIKLQSETTKITLTTDNFSDISDGLSI